MKNIYLMFSYTGSILSMAIKMVKKEDYTHVSIGIDEDLGEFYSFGRKHPYNPLVAGFVSERLKLNTYEAFPNAHCRIFKVSVSDKQYGKIIKQIEIHKRYSNKLKYNFLGLLTASINIPYERIDAYFCSQFVSTILLKANIHISDLNPGLISPGEILKYIEKRGAKLIYSGKISELHNTKSRQRIHRRIVDKILKNE